MQNYGKKTRLRVDICNTCLRFVSLLLIVVFCFGCSKKDAHVTQNVVLRVGTDVLTLDEIQKQVPLEKYSTLTREQVANYVQVWLEKELLVQEAYRTGLDKHPDLPAVLKQAERDFLVNLLIDSVYSKDVYVPEQEMINYYERNKENYDRSENEIHTLCILVDDEKVAYEARRRILRGEDFEQVAKEVSIDYARRNRIDMGYFKPSEVVPEIARHVFDYKVGSVTSVIKSDFGYHIFKILDRRNSHTVKDYEEVKDEIRNNIIADRKTERYQNYITSLKSNVEIVSNYGLLNQLFNDDKPPQQIQKVPPVAESNMEHSND
ncbi:peptidyl-prolyl cis-trans isomerase [candidate division KSB1 bacterium]|nr:peptidyl-prolyl cis-trans isomerase [candidate division KSB1 bacterium]